MHRAFTPSILAVIAGAALSPSIAAFAQDSVSRNTDAGNGLPGDAPVFAFADHGRLSYVVDLAPLSTSWRTSFGIAPIVKSSRMVAFNGNRFSLLMGASSISASVRSAAAYPSATYTLWTAATGGLDINSNNTALNSSVSPTGTATVFGTGFLAFSEFVGPTVTLFANEIIGAQVAFNPAAPTRLYITRTSAAHNTTGVGVTDRSQFGYGGVDADGNIAFRADSLTATSTTNLLAGENYFRVNLPLRNTNPNLIDSVGASNSTSSTRLVNNGAITITTPTLIPSELAGRSVLIGNNFINQFLREGSPNTVTATSAHLSGATDHRGPASFSAAQLFAGSIGTTAVISRSPAAAGRNDSISLCGLDANANPLSARTITLPATLADACGGFSIAGTSVDFRNYESQVPFRGGNGPVAITKDQSGRALAAAVVYNRAFTANTDNPYVAIAVARFDPASAAAPTWSLAAWTNTATNSGKQIRGDFGLDGIPNTLDSGEGDGLLDATPIGRLASMTELSIGKAGPSISAPMLDSVGNIYFTASVALNARVGTTNVTEYTTALLRAVYDPVSFCYSLELVLKVGDSFPGQNSQRRYRIASLGLADLDSVASEAPWSGNITGGAWNNQSAAALAPQSPRTLGGLVLPARIVYDVDQNGSYEDPTNAGGNTASIDEAYDVLLYLGNTDNTAPCPADLDDDGDIANGLNPDGGVDINDLLAFLRLFEDGNIGADLDDDGDATVGHPDGGVDINDLIFFLQRFEAGC